MRLIEELETISNKYNRALNFPAKVIVSLALWFNILNICYAQGPVFTSNSEVMLMSNPGFAGVNDQMNTYGIHKNQWFGLFQTTAVGFDTKVNLFNKEHGVGLTIFQDKYDLVEDLWINFIYSYRHSLWNGTISYGAQVGFDNRIWTGGINDSSLISDYYTSTSEFENLKDEVNSFKFDMGFGAFYKDDKMYFGASVAHLFQPEMPVTEDESMYLYTPRSFYAMAGYTIVPLRKSDIEIKPSIFFRTHGTIIQTEVLADVWYKKQFKGGLGYRLQESIFFTAGWKMKNGLYVGAAYDVVTSHIALGQVGYGSLEFLVRYSFDIEFNKRDFKYKSIRLL